MNKNLKIKWNKDVFDVEVNENHSILDLKKEIHRLKNIEPSGQKLMLKGKILDDAFSTSSIQDGVQLTLLGKPTDTNPITSLANEKPVKFLEDLTEKEIAEMKRDKGEVILYGLENLGNTCYFNSVYQCLGRTDLRRYLKEYAKTQNFSQSDMNLNFALALGRTYDELDKATDTVVPKMLIGILRTINPLFAEQDQGRFKQQDAVECFEFILNTLKLLIKTPGDVQNKFSDNLIDELFSIQYDIRMKSIGEEIPEEKVKSEMALKIVCFIDKDTNELLQGLRDGIKENVELRSDLLQRNVIFEKTQLISRIPPFLTVQFMRFFWKQANESIFGSDGQAGKAKKLKSVIFSKVLDIYDLCNDDTKALLDLGRSIETKLAESDKNYSITNPKNPVTENMIPTGRYLLIAVTTHKGRSSDSGHYIGWTQLVENKWVRYDDDIISFQNDQQIQDLKGGGDHHMAYLCFYKRLEVPFQEL